MFLSRFQLGVCDSEQIYTDMIVLINCIFFQRLAAVDRQHKVIAIHIQVLPIVV